MHDHDPVHHTNYLTILEAAVSAAQAAGAMLRAEFHRGSGRRGSGQLAAIDREVELVLKEQLLSVLPCRWLGEETGSTRDASSFVWVVDPHDGTGAFLRGRRGSSVSIALLRNATPVLGVVYAFGYPNDDGDLISWAEGTGPLRRNGQLVEQRCEEANLTRDAVVALSYGASRLPQENAVAVAPARFLAVPSIAYRLALAACGDAVAAVALNPLSSWDFAAGHALLRAAGGILVDSDGREVNYNADGTAGTTMCFGGARQAALKLAERDWSKVMRPGPGDPRAASPKTRVEDADRLSRAQGCLLGQVAGDALGALVEFESRSAIVSKFPNGVRRLADGGLWEIIAGQPTDDSELAIALGRCLVEHRRFDSHDILTAYQNWYRSSPFDVGATTRNALALGQTNPTSQANGSLMRISPVGVFAAGRPQLAATLAAEDSRLTHPHPVCLASCATFAAAIAVGIAGGTRDEMVEAALEFAGEGANAEIVRRVVCRAQSEKPSDFETQMGWVLIALQNAFYHLHAGTSVAEAVVSTVSEGGDTDTNAAIVGALVGAADGHNAFPDQWRRMVLSCRPMTVTGAAEPRPVEYWPDDLLELAEGLLEAGAAQ